MMNLRVSLFRHLLDRHIGWVAFLGDLPHVFLRVCPQTVEAQIQSVVDQLSLHIRTRHSQGKGSVAFNKQQCRADKPGQRAFDNE